MSTAPNVDALIAEASRTQDMRAVAAALAALDLHEVFYRAVVTPTEAGQRVTAPLVRLGDGSHALVVFTAKTHPDLPQKFGGAPWRHVLTMATQLPTADWLIVSTDGGHWLPIGTSQINGILEILDAAASPGGDDVIGGSAITGGGDLDALISAAHLDSDESWVDRLLASVTDRELYVRISPGRVEDGRPALITSTVADVRGLVQVYTSRIRPGLTYGGMNWDDIVGVLRDAHDIGGVHIVNDRDDWIVLRRSDIQRTATDGRPEDERR